LSHTPSTPHHTSELVDCLTLDGQTKAVPIDCLTLRPAAYALIVHDGKLLLLKLRASGKYHLPGGGIKIGERMTESLKRETREETGIEIDVEQLAHFEELFFYYDPSGRAYHGLHFYYHCRARTFGLLADESVDDGSAEQPRWITIQGLHAEDFQHQGELILRLCNRAVTQQARAADLPVSERF